MMMFHFTSGKLGFRKKLDTSGDEFVEDESVSQNLPAEAPGGTPGQVEEKESHSKPGESVYRPSFTSNRELVMRMLKREQELRMCERTQRLYDGEDWNQPNIPPYTIEDDIQRQVLREHGLDCDDETLDLYRCLNGLYRNDPEVRQLIVYMKHDISRQGDLRIGFKWPDVTLQTLDEKPVQLSSFYRDREKPFIILGASRS